VSNGESHHGWGGRSAGWTKYAVAALAIHAAVLTIPVAQKATQAAKQRVIDVIVMRQEKPPAPPVPARETVPPRPVARAKVKEPVRIEPAPPQQKIAEKRETAPPAGGAGNAIDEQMVAQVSPGPATGGGEGVGVSGVNVRGGKVGPGSGSGLGSGVGPGTRAAVAPPAAAAEMGPAETRIGEGDGPQWIHRQMPEYPFAAKRLGREGRVELKVTIDEKGRVQNVEVIFATDASFGQAATEAVKRSRIAPAKQKGTQIPSWFKCTYRFGLS
jgi:periplasmic protein TonB